jgi:hypothetical protein
MPRWIKNLWNGDNTILFFFLINIDVDGIITNPSDIDIIYQ